MIAVVLIIAAVVAVSVAIHYEFLFRLTLLMPKMKIRHRQRIVLGVIVALLAHGFEIFIFALAYYGLNRVEGWGSLQGNFDGSLVIVFIFHSRLIPRSVLVILSHSAGSAI